MRTHRGDEPEWHYLAVLANSPTNLNQQYHRDRLEREFKVHASEYSSVGLAYDYHLDNNGTIDHLHTQLENILNSQQ
jgi:hypothetical protein